MKTYPTHPQLNPATFRLAPALAALAAMVLLTAPANAALKPSAKVAALFDFVDQTEMIAGEEDALKLLRDKRADFTKPEDQANIDHRIAKYLLGQERADEAKELWNAIAVNEAVSTPLRCAVYLELMKNESYPLRLIEFSNQALALKGLEPTDKSRVIFQLARSRKRSNFYDMALELFQQAADVPGISASARCNALIESAIVARELRLRDTANKALEAAIATDASAAQVVRAYTELVLTHIHPMQYDWIADEGAINAALADYKRVTSLPGLRANQRFNMLYGIAKAQFRAKKYEDTIDTCNMLIKFGGFDRGDKPLVYELIGDSHRALKDYRAAVHHYESAITGDKYRVLNKIGDTARIGKDFERAMIAYSDLIPLIDKVENKADYSRVSRLLVIMTKATRSHAKPKSADDVFRSEEDRALMELTLDEF